MQTLIYLCGFGEFFFGLSQMATRTIKESGYKGDLFIISDANRKSPFADCLNLADHPQARQVSRPGGRFFHSGLGPEFGSPKYQGILDCAAAKYLPNGLINKSQYDFVLYLDSDILVHHDGCLSDIFASQKPISDHNSRSALRDMKSLQRHLTESERFFAGSIRGVGGGGLGLPNAYLGFFDKFQECYQRYQSEVPHEQPILSYIKVHYAEKYPLQQWPNRKYFRHYWGGKKKQMVLDYASRFGKHSLTEIFPNIELDSIFMESTN